MAKTVQLQLANKYRAPCNPFLLHMRSMEVSLIVRIEAIVAYTATEAFDAVLPWATGPTKHT